MTMNNVPTPRSTVAYFCMEIGLDPAMPTYSGGLGVLAGDSLRAAADLGLNLVGVTLLHRKGFARQHLDASGNQTESPNEWRLEEFLEPVTPRVMLEIEGRAVQVAAWRYSVRGVRGHVIPVYFLDTAVPENNPWDQDITNHLYGGDDHYRLCQEAVLGIGGARMLQALGIGEIGAYHMNEGHSALLTLALLEQQLGGAGGRLPSSYDIELVRRRCIFTTHTPVPAGHDKFSWGQVQQVLGQRCAEILERAGCCQDGSLNMTYLALRFSRYINGVSLLHKDVSQSMFPNYPINSITNGVHAATWTSSSFAQLYDRYFPEWRSDNTYLFYAMNVSPKEILRAHAYAKLELLKLVEDRTGAHLDPAVFTIGFARRVTGYKRADLLFSDLERLKRIVNKVGPLQVIYAGKAHPRDEGGKALIRKIFAASAALRNDLQVVYLEGYDMNIGKTLCAGADLWLNNPQKPHEASGTSGMKAALNGVPSLSVLDGWWVEGHLEGVTGWAIGDPQDRASDQGKDMASLYDKLERVIMPMFYHRPADYAGIMRYAIAINGSFFNAQRMMFQYLGHAYQSGALPANIGGNTHTSYQEATVRSIA